MSSTLLPPPREQLCNSSCSNKTHIPIYAFICCISHGPAMAHSATAICADTLTRLSLKVTRTLYSIDLSS